MRHPGLLFNIGQCHRNLKHCVRALFFFRRHLNLSTSPASKRHARLLITLTDKLHRAQQERLREAARRRAALLRPRLHPDPMGPKVPVEGPTVHRRFYQRWWFWTVIATGIAAVVGVSVGVAAWPKNQATLPGGTLGTVDARQ